MSEQTQEPMDAFQEPTNWPKVIGIISMVWAGLNLTCAGCGLFGIVASTAFVTEEMKAKGLPPTMGLNLSNGISLSVGTVMAVVLFTAGLMTLRRSMLGRTLHLMWSAVSILWIPLAMYLIFRQNAEMDRWAAENPENQFAKQHVAGRGIGMAIGMAITLVFSLYPVFIFIWFTFLKKTKESFGADAVKDYI